MERAIIVAVASLAAGAFALNIYSKATPNVSTSKRDYVVYNKVSNPRSSRQKQTGKDNPFLSLVDGKIVRFPRGRKAFEAKVQKIKSAGVGALQVVSDFDHTLSAYRLEDGTYGDSCHGIFGEGPSSNRMSQKYKDGMTALWDEQKVGKEAGNWQCLTWWTKNHAMMVQEGLTNTDIKQMVREANFGVRTGAGEFVSMLQQMGVPMLVVSAGITQVVEEVLKSFGLWRTSGMEIASNTMTFDAGGKLVGFANADSIIHPESKCSVWKWKRVSYFGRDDMSKRRNLVVIGDSVSDCDVVLGSEKDVDTVLKIGFYNHDGRSRYPQPYDGYASAFDVVITDDGSFTFVQDLFEDIQRS